MQISIEQHWLNWKKQTWSQPTVSWQDGFIANGFCPECRLCCGPQIGDKPFPMALLPEQLHARISEDFYMYDASHASLDERGCKALSAKGCNLPRSRRPPACGIFPIVLTYGSLFLYTLCPASLLMPLSTWLDLSYKVRDWLRTFPLEIQEHINIKVEGNFLLQRYVNLHVQVF